MQSVFIAIRPFDRAANVRRNVYVGDAPSGEGFGAGGVAWEPALIVRPKLSIELFSLEMDGKVQTGKAVFAIGLDALRQVPRPRDLLWRGALVQIWIGDSVEGPAPVPDFSGYVTQPSLDTDTGRLSITAEVTDVLIDRPLLSKTFGGGGGLDGDPGKRGVFLPAGFGAVFNIEPIWFDAARNIGMIDGYGNCVAIDNLFEGRSGFGARVADYPSYAALAAAIDAKAIAPGAWGSCVAQGLVGLGAPPEKPITVDARFGADRPGLFMRRVAQVHAGVAADLIDAGSFAALDIMVDRPTGYWTGEQRNCKDLLEAIARSCNATPLISFQGRLTVTRAVSSLPLFVLDRTGNAEPRVTRWRNGQSQPPYNQLRARCARPARVLTTDEINYVDSLVDRGLYSASETYRAGNIVWLSDGSQWLYTSAVPSAGNSPALILPPDTVGDYWTQMQPPKKATDFRYATGETIESLKPRQAGADVTGSNVSAAVQGQGQLATRNDVLYGSQITGLPTPIQPGNFIGGLYLDARQV
ncbi:MAG: hypothetical protein K2X76_05220, partial [Sphingomonas sp.]|nr:hypothetical protein [Sphingomonas sp.]